MLIDLAITAIGLTVFGLLGLFVIDMNRQIRERER
jgi:hypothetical protein